MLAVHQIDQTHTRSSQDNAADVLVNDLHSSDARALGIAIAEVVKSLTGTPVPDADTQTEFFYKIR